MEISAVSQKDEEHEATIRNLKRELNDERQERREEREAAAVRQKRDQEEIEGLRMRYERLEAERAEMGPGVRISFRDIMPLLNAL